MSDLQTQLTNRALPQRGQAGDINSFNGYMRQQPWYQQWFQQQGLNPNQVHLNDAQRHQLEGVLAQHGYSLHGTDGMNIDPAGNLNNPHGFASQPTWLKAIEIGAPIAATAGFGMAGMGPLSGVLGGTSGAAGEVGTLAGAGLPTAELTPSLASYGFGAGATGAAGAAGGTGATLASMTGAPISAVGAAPQLATIGPNLTAGMSTMPAAGATSVSGAGSFLSNLLHPHMPGKQDALDAASSLGAFANQAAQNRGANANISGNYTNQMLASQANQRAQESDAMRKLGESGYILQGGSHFKPPTISLGGQQRTTPDLGYGPIAPSDAQKQAATTLQDTMLKRVQPNSGYTPPPLTDFTQSGGAEKAANAGSLILGGLNTARSLFGF